MNYIIALAVALAFTVPAFAADAAPADSVSSDLTKTGQDMKDSTVKAGETIKTDAAAKVTEKKQALKDKKAKSDASSAARNAKMKKAAKGKAEAAKAKAADAGTKAGAAVNNASDKASGAVDKAMGQ
jgi:hypothetical protein